MREEPMRRLRSLWRGPAVDRVIAVAGVAGLASIAWLFGEIVRMATDYPAPLAAVCAASFLLGVLLAYALGIRDERAERRAAEREREAREAEEARRAEREAAEREDRLCKEVRGMDFLAKRFLCAVYDGGPRAFDHCREVPWDVEEDYRNMSWDIKHCPLLVGETVDEGVCYDVTAEGRSLLDRHPGLLERARESIAAERRGEGV